MAFFRASVAKAVTLIINDIVHLPSGYPFWFSLSGYKRRVMIQKWRTLILDTIFDAKTKALLIDTCLDTAGCVCNKAMYDWLVVNVYGGSEAEVFAEWLRTRWGDKT